MHKKLYSTLLVDIDMTLLDFDKSERLCIKEVLKYFGAEPTENACDRYHEINQSYWKRFELGEIEKHEILGNRFRDLFEELKIPVDGEKANAIYGGHLKESAILMPDAEESCSYLASKYQMYIVTNGLSVTQKCRMERSGLNQYFQGLFVSEDANSQKPKREFYDYCFERMPKVERSEVLMIGDSLSSDIQGGINAGLDTCWLRPEACRQETDLSVTYIIQELKDLKGFL